MEKMERIQTEMPVSIKTRVDSPEWRAPVFGSSPGINTHF